MVHVKLMGYLGDTWFKIKSMSILKYISILLLFIAFQTGLSAQGLTGAWESDTLSENGESLRAVLIFSDSFYAASWFNAETGEFNMTKGGSWKLDGETLTKNIEFDSADPDRVGAEASKKILLKADILAIEGMSGIWRRTDDGGPGALRGAWLMSGRVRDGETQTRDTNRPRKTMKVLSGTRFQWIAYNTETKEFMGSGGGTYTTVNGKYTENIEFFSRDNSRVGISLEFDYELKDGNWHHKGFSSKGDPMHEIWSRRE